ncbi:MAG: DUF2071 domain-containing protein [Armatimonadaceae bacterium]
MDRIAPTRRPEQPVVMRQTWQKLLFLHWSVEPAVLQRLLPSGLTVDTFEGNAYIGLVPFTMRNVRPVWSPPVRGLSHFHETNVRTYVHRDGAEPGVWFFSLDAANPVAVQIARTVWKLPYYFARMSLTEQENQITYASERIGPAPVRGPLGGPVGCHVRCQPVGTPCPAKPDTLECFLAERYILYSHDGSHLYFGRVHHTPYPLQTAVVTEWEENLTAAAGIQHTSDAPLAHYASGVDVEVFPLQRAGQT